MWGLQEDIHYLLNFQRDIKETLSFLNGLPYFLGAPNVLRITHA